VEGLLGAGQVKVSAEVLASRTQVRLVNAAHRPPSRLGEDEGPPPPDDWLPPAVARVNGALMTAMSVEYPSPNITQFEKERTVLKGNAASRGKYEGRACVVQGPGDFAKLRQGDVLVAPFTTTSYNVVLPLLGAVVTDKGGVLSHAAIVAREYAIPAVVNTVNATAVIAHGYRVRVDGDGGTIEILEGSSSPDTSLSAAPILPL
jgi:rifampicin phosphotransferase